MKNIHVSLIFFITLLPVLLLSAPFDGLRQAFQEERAAFTSMQTIAPGLKWGNIFSYTRQRIGQSGVPLAASVASTVLLSLLFERFAKTHSRARAKKMAVVAYLLAALYGSQLRQRGEPFDRLSLADPLLFNRLLLVFGSSVIGTFVLNVVLDWYHGSKGIPASLKQTLAWALEMGVFNTYAAGTAYFLDKAPTCG